MIYFDNIVGTGGYTYGAILFECIMGNPIEYKSNMWKRTEA